MRKTGVVALLLSILFIECGFPVGAGAGTSVLPQKMEKTFKPATPERMAADNKVEYIDKNEKDCDAGKGERYDIGVILYADWDEDAAYVCNPPPSYGTGPSYTQWDYKCEYISRFTTRVYLMQQTLPPAKLEVAKATFFLYPKKITGAYILKDKKGRIVANGVKVMPTPSMITGEADIGFNIFANNFHLDLTLASVVMPTVSKTPIVTLTPFLAALEPDVALEMGSLNPKQVLVNPTVFNEKFNRAFFKAPIRIEGLSIDRLKKGPVTKQITDQRSGKGLVSKLAYTTGRLNCFFNIRASVYLKRIQDDGYVPGMPDDKAGSDGWYGPEGPKGGEGKGPPGVVKRPGDSTPPPEGKKDASAKQPRGGAGDISYKDIVSHVRAKAARMLNRALREMGMRKASSDFMGSDYRLLGENRKTSLLGKFANAGLSESVVIGRGVDFYRGSLNNFYDRHRNLEGGLFLETLLTLIIMEYDWSEPGVDKDELARQYLGKSLYDANRSRRGR